MGGELSSVLGLGFVLKVQPADRVESWLLDRIIPHERNVRTHDDKQVGLLADLMLRYGIDQPIVVDEAGVILKGHGRRLAAIKVGFSNFPVVVQRGLSADDKRAIRIADNQVALLSGWDAELLRLEVSDLKLNGYDMPLLGFGDLELGRLLGDKLGLTDPDEVSGSLAEPVTQCGDVWVLGRHRLICGDATKAEDVTRVLDGAKPHLMVTDPPYGVEYDPDWRNRADRANGKPYGARAVGTVNNDDRADWREAWGLFPGDVAYTWSPLGDLLIKHHDSLIAAGFEIRMQIIWAKQQFIIGRGNYHVQHEPCWYAVRDGKTAHWSGDRSQSTLWQINKPVKSETGHSTQKPVECMKRPIENNSAPGDAVYDPFVGSGTTIIAAEMTGRVCHAIEIEPAYCDVVVTRWQNFTGQKAERMAAVLPSAA